MKDLNNFDKERINYICRPANFLGFENIPRSVHESCERIAVRLRSKLYPAPSYGRMAELNIKVSGSIRVRKSIQELVDERKGFNFNNAESIHLEQCCSEFRRISESSIYAMAEVARLIAFKASEPPRDFNLTIRFLRELIIPPPLKTSDLYKPTQEFFKGNAVAYAIKTYLILLSEHPYRDGNGRVARLVFNAILKTSLNPLLSYIPLSDLTLLTFGAYEESLAKATKTGNYNEIFELIVSLISQYLSFLEGEISEAEYSEPENEPKKIEFSNIEILPPIKLSINEFTKRIGQICSHAILDKINILANKINAYGAINFALFTDCAEISKSHPRSAITFFLSVANTEELRKDIRMLRSSVDENIILHVIPLLNEPSVDAKLLLTQYVIYSKHSKDYPILLTDFNVDEKVKYA
ncbi:hypothetical protein FHW58_005476 [Duganella sp. 1224]|uniref:Fic family protein n=1 Tax=Duganella sp. 1224 TaxID=2587052 RepID=UPI0015CD48D7|nr:Fic family protein [Duganella sp. 1224]NYE64238.1 hypothetical protein [Duganella sp. 1224]